MTDEASGSGALNEPAPVPPAPVAAPPSPPPGRKFAGPFFFWLFLFATPVGVAASALCVYVHEFAHGLAALVTGGYFLGVQGQLLHRPSQALAYADAWSEGWDGLVLLAGIIVNVLVGVLLLRCAFRIRSVVPKLILFIFASAFLTDISYAFDGFLQSTSSDHDTALLLQNVNSAPLRWAGLVVSFSALAINAFIVGRGMLRAWEEVFGELSPSRAFWVVLLLIGPVPLPTPRSPGPGYGVAVYVTLFLVVLVWLVRRRRRAFPDPSAVRFSPWGWAGWAGAAAGVFGFVCLERGIRFGTFPDNTPYDLHVREKTVAGFSGQYGMGDRFGSERPLKEPKLFVSTPEGWMTVPSPAREVVDVAWVPSRQRLLVVSPWGVYDVEARSGEATTVWGPSELKIKTARHGAGGELVIVAERAVEGGTLHSLFVYDPRLGKGKIHVEHSRIGNPFFLLGSPVKAMVTVGDDMWAFTWPQSGEEEVKVDTLLRGSVQGWFEGSSGETPWWFDAEGWRTEKARVANQGLSNWGAGREGFFTLGQDGAWRVTGPDGPILRSGSIEAGSVLLLRFHDGDPWTVFRSGEVRRMGEGTPAFHVQFPR